ncbi:MAG: alanine racemase [Frankia sp.]|nr:alanine racemase [Frankia sp.]
MPAAVAPALAVDARAWAEVDLDAIRTSVATLKRCAGSAAVMAVVKADGYGHGAVPSARAALEAGATWLGVAYVEEALELRMAGLRVPILLLVEPPPESTWHAVANDVDVVVATPRGLDAARRAAEATEKTARVHLKVDTGLTRGGALAAQWPELCAAAARATGAVRAVGVWSHFAHADDPGHPTITAQLGRFAEALDVATAHGLRPDVRHLANSAATLTLPAAHYDLVRPGVSVYGLSPGVAVGDPQALGLAPAMTLRARVALVKRVAAGTGVSYGHRYTTSAETTVALVPLGYADGVPRAATNAAEVLAAGSRRRIAGTVCMDQFVVDVGNDEIAPGDEVTLFGPGGAGEPTADDWAQALGTISYEIVTRVGARVPRVYRGER